MIRRVCAALTLSIILHSPSSHAQNPVCHWPGEQTAHSSIADGNGGVIVAWHDSRAGNTNWDIYAQRLDASGNAVWAVGGVPLTKAVNDQANPILVSDGAGGAIVTWTDQRFIGTSSGEDIYAQHINAMGAVLWASDGVAVCSAARHQDPGSIISWSDGRSGDFGDPLAVDVYAQRIDGNGLSQWTANGVPLVIGLRAQLIQGSVSDNAGGAVVTWIDSRVLGSTQVYAQRINGLGVSQWAANGVMLMAVGGTALTMISDGAAGAIISLVVASGSPVTTDIYAQRVNSAGAVQWSANGVAVCTAAGNQNYPRAASDGSGGAIVTWEDMRSGVKADIYAQRIDNVGTVQWDPDGIGVSIAVQDQFKPAIVADGIGGAIVSWHDGRSSAQYDIYAQKIDASGVSQWDPDGMVVSATPANQMRTTIVTDGAGGGIVCWERAGYGWDIYAQHVPAAWEPAPVPVLFSSIRIESKTDGVFLNWNLNADEALDGFEIFRSGSDGERRLNDALLDPETRTFHDSDVTPGSQYNYVVVAVLPNGDRIQSQRVAVRTQGATLALFQNWPNPFNPTTTISFQLPDRMHVSLSVFDIQGRLVRNLRDEVMEAGHGEGTWDGRDNRGGAVASGVYFCKLVAGNSTLSQRMVLLK